MQVLHPTRGVNQNLHPEQIVSVFAFIAQKGFHRRSVDLLHHKGEGLRISKLLLKRLANLPFIDNPVKLYDVAMLQIPHDACFLPKVHNFIWWQIIVELFDCHWDSKEGI